MTANQPLLPEIFADAILDLHFEGGVFRLTLAQVVPQPNTSSNGEHRSVLMPKATLLLTENGFGSLCNVVDHVREEVAKHELEEGGSSPNFG